MKRSGESSVNLQRFTPEQLKEAVREKRKIDSFREKTLLEQIIIILKHKGISITAIATLIFSGGIWQKENIKQILNPPIEISVEDFSIATASNYILEQQITRATLSRDKQLIRIQDDLSVLSSQLYVMEQHLFRLEKAFTHSFYVEPITR